MILDPEQDIGERTLQAIGSALGVDEKTIRNILRAGSHPVAQASS
jgi:hypothetical protein